MAPRQHCYVATQAAHLGRTDVAVLGASTTNGDTLPAKLDIWLTQFALWFHPEALRLEPPKVPAFQFPSTTLLAAEKERKAASATEKIEAQEDSGNRICFTCTCYAPVNVGPRPIKLK
jgi:hypothetical protein